MPLPIYDSSMRLISVFIDEVVHADLHAWAGRTGVTFSEHIRRALDQYRPFWGCSLSGANVVESSVKTTSGRLTLKGPCR